MPNRYDVEDYTLPYGSVGGAMARTMQAEVLRRAQVRQLEEEQARRDAQLAYERQRQAQLDADKRENDRIDREIKRETLAGTTEARKAVTAANEQKLKDAQIAAFQKSTKRGKVSKEQRAEGERLGLGHLFLAKPVIGPETEQQVENVPTYSEDFVGPPAPPTMSTVKVPGAPTGEMEDTYLGTPEEQKKDEQAAKRKEILGGSLRNDPRYGKDENYDRLVNYFETKAMLEEMGEDQLPPGQMLAQPKSATETKAQRDLKLQDIMAKPRDQWTPEEAALVSGRRSFNELQGEEARTRQDITIRTGNERLEDTQTERAKAAAFTRGNKDFDDLRFTLSRAGNLAESLAAGGGVGDAVAAPDFLSMMAGGFGTGLRMTDTELNRINLSQNKFSTLRSIISDYAARRPFKLDETQRADMLKLAQFIAKRELRRVDILKAGLDRINAARTADEVRAAENQLDKDQLDILGKASEHLGFDKHETAPAAPAKPGSTGFTSSVVK